jgi:hypothetical protein
MYDTPDYPTMMRLLFAKFTKDAGVNFKIPKDVQPSSFNVFFKNLKVVEVVFGKQHKTVDIKTVLNVEKSISGLIKDYCYWDAEKDNGLTPFVKINKGRKWLELDFAKQTSEIPLYNEKFVRVAAARHIFSLDGEWSFSIQGEGQDYFMKRANKLCLKIEKADEIGIMYRDYHRDSFYLNRIGDINLLEKMTEFGY